MWFSGIVLRHQKTNLSNITPDRMQRNKQPSSAKVYSKEEFRIKYDQIDLQL